MNSFITEGKDKKYNQDSNLYNLDGKWIINRNTGMFYMNFSDEQKEEIEKAIEEDIPIESFAYPRLSAKSMRNIRVFLYEQSAGGHEPTPVEIWKIVNTAMSDDQMMWCFVALSFGRELVEEIPGIVQYEPELLNMIVMGISCGKDVIKKVYPGMDISLFLPDMILMTHKAIERGKENIITYAYEEKEPF